MVRDHRPRIPRDQLLDTQQIARLLANERPPLAQQVTDRSLFLLIDILTWQYYRLHLVLDADAMPA
jgi:hypothetical protein